MLKPVCIPCHRFFRCIKTGFMFTEGMPVGSNVEPGMAEPEKWKPYKVWMGDKFKCEGCGAEIISGFGKGPIRIQHETDFDKWHSPEQFQVNDC